MSHVMSPARHDVYVSRRATERERATIRKVERRNKLTARAFFGGTK